MLTCAAAEHPHQQRRKRGHLPYSAFCSIFQGSPSRRAQRRPPRDRREIRVTRLEGRIRNSSRPASNPSHAHTRGRRAWTRRRQRPYSACAFSSAEAQGGPWWRAQRRPPRDRREISHRLTRLEARIRNGPRLQHTFKYHLGNTHKRPWNGPIFRLSTTATQAALFRLGALKKRQTGGVLPLLQCPRRVTSSCRRVARLPNLPKWTRPVQQESRTKVSRQR